MMSTCPRVMIVGWDGATLDLVEPWVRAGHLPVLASLMRSGAYSRLRSVLPVVSSAAWATFSTGVNPGKHGMFDFVYRGPGGYRLRPVTRQDIRSPSLWRLLSEHGKRVVVLNVPMTYPPEPVNGFLVSGLGTPDFRTFTHPSELGDRLLQDGYRVNRRVYHAHNREEQYLRDSYEMTEQLTRVALSLLSEAPWDLSVIVYRDSDVVTHGLWHHMDPSHPAHEMMRSPRYQSAILEMYQRLDQDLGKLVSAAGPDAAVFVVSDHGAGPLYKEVYLNEWLRQQGYLVPRALSPTRQVLARVGLTRSNVSRALRWARLGWVERALKDMLGNRIDLLPRAGWADLSEGIDWSRTRAYSFGYQGQVYINLAGREPEGIVAQGGEYEALREELCQALSELTDPDDGEPVVDRIDRQEGIYRGPYLDRAPDLVLTMRDLSYVTRQGFELGNQGGEVFSSSRIHESGGHRLDGMLVAAGPGVGSMGGERPTAWLGDIAPTALHMLGCSVPATMDGRVLREWFSRSVADRRVVISQAQADHTPEGDTLSDGDEKELLRRLQGLGYLD